MEQIPVWEKYAISPEEASKLFSLPAEFFDWRGNSQKRAVMTCRASGLAAI